MIREELELPIQRLPGAGPKTAERLASLGVTTIGELLYTMPRTYEDRSKTIPIATAARGLEPGRYARCVTVVQIAAHQFFGPKRHLKIVVRDRSGSAGLVCFGRNFLAQTLTVGRVFLLSAWVTRRYGEVQASSFETEPLPPDVVPRWLSWIEGNSIGPEPGAGTGSDADSYAGRLHGYTGTDADADADAGSNGEYRVPLPHTRQFGMILPRYPNIAGIGEQKVRSLVHAAVDRYGKHLEDPLPGELLDRHGFPAYSRALEILHAGGDPEELRIAADRMIYHELFVLQLNLAWQASLRKTAAPSAGSPPTGRGSNSMERVRSSLGFDLTGDQKRVLETICLDLDAPTPMSRLLQGDVGSGKTVVALLAAAFIIDRKRQAVLMAPTELLARQHADIADKLFRPHGLSVAFLSGGLTGKARKALLEELRSGRIDLLVGTHAVFTSDVEFRDLGLSIVDEQHRFGVRQRTALLEKGNLVHLLLMTATPIPRTLALTVYGDLEISSLIEKPAGRLEIETHLARMGNEAKVYRFVEGRLERGNQAYFIYPRIDEETSDDSGTDSPDDFTAAHSAPGYPPAAARDEDGPGGPQIKSVTAMFEYLNTVVYPGYTLGLIHGQLKDEEKIRIMDEFARGAIQILVSTTVVEVGVDVPNATCMVIEHAERFGLAALHQLRGRVGRSDLQSYCFLVYREPLTETAKERLKILKQSTDGFLIAEKDLELRGPGDIQGIQQSGFLKLTFADLGRDMAVMNTARAEAFALLHADPELRAPGHENLRRLVTGGV